MFAELDAPALKPLPDYPYHYTKVVSVLVGKDYHVDLEKHYYSVPYALQGKRLEAHLAEHTVTLYHAGKVVAEHPAESSQRPAQQPARPYARASPGTAGVVA
jgi:hypothetical protein